MTKTAVTQLVDRMLDAAAQAHPGVEYSIMLAKENTVLLHKDADELWRTVNGRLGTYAGHVYRDTLVDGFEEMIPHLIIVGPVDGGDETSYYGDLRNSAFTDTYQPDSKLPPP